MSVSWVALVVSRPCGMGSDVAAALMEVGWRRWVTGTGAVAVGVVAVMFRSLRRLRAGCRTSTGYTPRAWPGDHVKAEPGKNAYVFEEVNFLGAPSRLCKLPIAMRGGARGDDEGDQQQGGEARGKAEDQSDGHEHFDSYRSGRPYGAAKWECLKGGPSGERLKLEELADARGQKQGCQEEPPDQQKCIVCPFHGATFLAIPVTLLEGARAGQRDSER